MTSPGSGKHWRPYQMVASTPLSLHRVHHLHRRAGFGANWSELQRDMEAGPDATVDRILGVAELVKSFDVDDSNAEPKVLTTSATDFDSLQQLIGDAAVSSGDINRLKAWWFYRILYSGDPLTERMTLMWHNHFATSNLKVANVAMMKRQNDLLRRHAMGKFGDLLRAVVKDAAMMAWLDAKANRKGKPNENLARELMELFTLGVGHYSETDVKEVARALTGWTVRGGDFEQVAAYHDDGTKQVLGEQGDFDGDDVLAILLKQKPLARRIAVRLCEAFFGEDVITDDALGELASGLRERDLDIGWAVETILRSEAFFADDNIGNRVLDPIQFMVGPLRSLEMLDPPPSTLLLVEWSTKLGQDLFYPPNVFGWPGGRSWLTTRTMIGRANFVSTLCRGDLHRPARPLGIEALALKHGYSSEATQANFASELLFGHQGQAGNVEMMLRSTAAHLG
ncbi:hypothetical protein K227x_33960 [Rubripirellula lacrimiformis]|uniref:DUF1800 domain-containing protein n=1 Tax=Rubripirellula lacrimiformis TaxID=1930273 RepID=A0A517ND60_9BACT|nr:DUF1800 domain-containing protein [Rubripirellula lacrimiformis]QDT04998.1 hypothetical protein K227x_33960 [Rubripirellula lacrimiformis]